MRPLSLPGLARLSGLAVLVGLAGVALPTPASACDCPIVKYDERWNDAELVLIVRALEIEPVVDVSEDGKTISMHHTTYPFVVLKALKGTPPETLSWDRDSIGGCWPGIGEGDVGLLLLDSADAEPSVCKGDGKLEWLIDSELPSLLRAAGAKANAVSSAQVEQVLRATSFADYVHSRTALQIELPPLAGKGFQFAKAKVKFVEESDDDNEQIDVLTALTHDGLTVLELFFPAEGVVVRAVLLDDADGKSEVIFSTLVER